MSFIQNKPMPGRMLFKINILQEYCQNKHLDRNIVRINTWQEYCQNKHVTGISLFKNKPLPGLTLFRINLYREVVVHNKPVTGITLFRINLYQEVVVQNKPIPENRCSEKIWTEKNIFQNIPVLTACEMTVLNLVGGLEDTELNNPTA